MSSSVTPSDSQIHLVGGVGGGGAIINLSRLSPQMLLLVCGCSWVCRLRWREGAEEMEGQGRTQAAESSQHTGKALTPLLQGPTATLLSLAGPGESMADGRRMGKAHAQTPPLSFPEAPAEEGRWGSVGAKGEHSGVIGHTAPLERDLHWPCIEEVGDTTLMC